MTKCIITLRGFSIFLMFASEEKNYYKGDLNAASLLLLKTTVRINVYNDSWTLMRKCLSVADREYCLVNIHYSTYFKC